MSGVCIKQCEFVTKYVLCAFMSLYTYVIYIIILNAV